MTSASSCDSCCPLLLATALHRFLFPYAVSFQEPFDITPTNPILAEGWREFMASYGLCSHALHALQVNTAQRPSHTSITSIFPGFSFACWKKRKKMSLNRLGLLLRLQMRVQMCSHTASKLSHFKEMASCHLSALTLQLEVLHGKAWT